MEHRSGNRKKISIPVILSQGEICHGRFLTLEMGSGGFSIACGLKALKPNSLVTIQLPLSVDGNGSQRSLRAFIIHKTPTTIGLMWAVPNISLTIDALTQEISHLHSPGFADAPELQGLRL